MEGGSYLICSQCIYGGGRDPQSQLKAVYLYPNLTSAIQGTFELRKNGVWAMVEGKFGKVRRVELELGFLPVPQLDEIHRQTNLDKGFIN